MKFEPIIISLLDTDLYKFNMNQVIFHYHTNLVGEYVFKCRNEDVKFTKEMLDEINEQIDHLCTLRFKEKELNYLRSIRYLKNDYIEFLRLWHPLRNYVTTGLEEDGTLLIKVDGPLFSAMQFEIYLLSIVNEVYFRSKYNYDELVESAREKLDNKLKKFENHEYNFTFSEFGTRRRLSRMWQEEVIKRLYESKISNATSNVYFAYKYNLVPVGTYAHEFVQMYQGIPSIPLAYTNKAALKDWFKEYDGDNGIALTDTITTDLFLKDFDLLEASVYKGVRHDSGDPYTWGEKIIAHYNELGINPKDKVLLFSDSLNFDKAQKLYDYFKGRCLPRFGIGTFVTNDTSVEPLNIVIKLQYVNGRAVAKLSDVLTKAMCQDDDYLTYLHNAVKWRLEHEHN